MNERIVFANQLRGLAALFVVASHLGAVFWGMRDPVAHHIGASIYTGPDAMTLPWLSYAYFNPGAFGVALFFLISGFVIPFSLEKMNRLQFLAARFFRIYPTYVISAGLALICVFYVSHLYGNTFPWDRKTLFANFTLTQSLFNYESVDLVNWTLQVELKFYLVAACIASLIRSAKVMPLIFLALLAAILNFATTTVPISAWSQFNLRAVITETAYISFMLIGVLFHYAIRGQIALRVFMLSVPALFAMFLSAWCYSLQSHTFFAITPSYGMALILFSCAYFLRNFFRANRLLDFFADISYPLYVVHSLFGYCVMRLLLDRGVNVYLCEIAALLLAVALAYALHSTVEMPSAKFGKKQSMQFFHGFSPLTTEDPA